MKDDTSGVFERLTIDNPAFSVYQAPNYRGVKLKQTEIPETPESIVEEMEPAWQKEKRRRPHLTNGTVLGVGYMKPKGDYVEMGVSPTEFKRYLTSREDRFLGYKLYAASSGALTRVRFNGDDYILFGERGKKAGNTGGKIELIPQGLMTRRSMTRYARLTQRYRTRRSKV